MMVHNRATNPTPDPIRVRLDPFFDSYIGLGFLHDDQTRTGTFDVVKEPTLFFAPGQRRHRYFDVHERAPAMFGVHATVSGAVSKSFTVVVDP